MSLWVAPDAGRPQEAAAAAIPGASPCPSCGQPAPGTHRIRWSPRHAEAVGRHRLPSLARMAATDSASSMREIAKLLLPASLSDAPTR